MTNRSRLTRSTRGDSTTDRVRVSSAGRIAALTSRFRSAPTPPLVAERETGSTSSEVDVLRKSVAQDDGCGLLRSPSYERASLGDLFETLDVQIGPDTGAAVPFGTLAELARWSRTRADRDADESRGRGDAPAILDTEPPPVTTDPIALAYLANSYSERASSDVEDRARAIALFEALVDSDPANAAPYFFLAGLRALPAGPVERPVAGAGPYGKSETRARSPTHTGAHADTHADSHADTDADLVARELVFRAVYAVLAVAHSMLEPESAGGPYEFVDWMAIESMIGSTLARAAWKRLGRREPRPASLRSPRFDSDRRTIGTLPGPAREKPDPWDDFAARCDRDFAHASVEANTVPFRRPSDPRPRSSP